MRRRMGEKVHPEDERPPVVKIRDSNGVVREMRPVSLRAKHAALEVVKKLPPKDPNAFHPLTLPSPGQDSVASPAKDPSLGMALALYESPAHPKSSSPSPKGDAKVSKGFRPPAPPAPPGAVPPPGAAGTPSQST